MEEKKCLKCKKEIPSQYGYCGPCQREIYRDVRKVEYPKGASNGR